MTDKTVQIFDSHPPGSYDERNRHFAPVSANLHFLTRLVLQGLPQQAKILCVGIGTGAELFELARAYPGWTFDGVDPSRTMLEDCRRRLAAEGLTERCRLHQGYLRDFAGKGPYDAVLCFLVMHFIRDPNERLEMYRDMHRRLGPSGFLVTADISADQNSLEYRDLVEHWCSMHGLAGHRQSGADMMKMIRENLGVYSPEETDRLLREAGFALPVQFAQSLLIRAWYAKK